MREWLIRKLGGVDAERCDRLSDEVHARNDELIDIRAELFAAVDAGLKAEQTIAELREIIQKHTDELASKGKVISKMEADMRIINRASAPRVDPSVAEFARGFESMSDAEGLAGLRDGLR